MKKNYDPELQSGRMFLIHQMAAIPTFMPSGRLKILVFRYLLYSSVKNCVK